MDNMIPFPEITPDMRVGSRKKEDTRPSRKEYLGLARNILGRQDYYDVLLAIMDTNYYISSDRLVREAADTYHNLED